MVFVSLAGVSSVASVAGVASVASVPSMVGGAAQAHVSTVSGAKRNQTSNSEKLKKHMPPKL